ncbi:GntR family transcriptional regulator [Brachybacterium kimchii]|uniref:GntR family transcriptional regulator n=1 Tax=Brachybacterium kimchii TaxID=2942909 RepID=A0ABY4N708_9MICO|nr:GntR family transcriptional regulator [Brachybacterium kimchii]UQN29621.1 GntR family transcriptional regulator [Brachybacterium kimchii]
MQLHIDPGSSDPIYEQIRAALAAAILSGELASGEALPSIRTLARDLRVSVITTTRAYNELVADGLADSVRGKGVFVRAQDPDELRSRALDRIERSLAEAVDAARSVGIDDATLRTMLGRRIEEER